MYVYESMPMIYVCQEDTKGQYFVAERVEYRLRPICGDLRGTQYLFGKAVRGGIAPIAKSLGWAIEL